MKIHRYIYTRLEKEESPRLKAGFQSAFWPEDLLDSGQILDLEANIHFPEDLGVAGKNTLFFQNINGETYLVVYYLFPQPEATDLHGRGGIFLCEGFLLGEKDWKMIPNLLDLIDFLEDKPFRTREKLLASAAIDLKKGTISPLEIKAEADYWEICAKKRQEEAEPSLLMILYHFSKGLLPSFKIMLEGKPQAITEQLAVAASFLPNELRSKISWDDAFDGGKAFFSQMNIFGFSSFPSLGGKEVRIGLEDAEVSWSEQEFAHLEKPTDPFSKWLMEVSVSPPVGEKIDAIFALSEAMRKNESPLPNFVSDPLFEAVNEAEVRSFFQGRLGQKIGPEWAAVIADMVPLNEQLGIWIENFPVEKLQRPLLAGILHRKIGPSKIKVAPPKALITTDNVGLQLMNAIWTGIVPDNIDYANYGETEICDWLRLMLLEGDHSEYYMEKMLPKCVEFLRMITRDSEVAEKLQPYILKKVPADYIEFGGDVATMAIRMGKFGSLVGEETDWNFLTERWLVEEGGDFKAWKAIKKMANKPGIDKYVILRAFALAEAPIPMELEHSTGGRKGLLNCLIEVHGFNQTQLMMMGFFGVEIKSTGANFGVVGKLKRFFRK